MKITIKHRGFSVEINEEKSADKSAGLKYDANTVIKIIETTIKSINTTEK